MRMYLVATAAALLLTGCVRPTAVENVCTRTSVDIEQSVGYRVVTYTCTVREESGLQLQHELETQSSSYEFVSNSEIRGVHRLVFKRSGTYRPHFENPPAP